MNDEAPNIKDIELEAERLKTENRILPGSILARPVDGVGGFVGANHEGIYVGGCSVIHFYGEQKSLARICSADYDSFAKGKQVTILKSPLDRRAGAAICLEATRICKSVMNGFNGEYNVFFKNCLHFCDYCFKAGHKRMRDYFRALIRWGDQQLLYQATEILQRPDGYSLADRRAAAQFVREWLGG